MERVFSRRQLVGYCWESALFKLTDLRMGFILAFRGAYGFDWHPLQLINLLLLPWHLLAAAGWSLMALANLCYPHRK